MYEKYFKRLLDIILSILILLVLSPLIVLIFILTWIFIGYPIFTQKRPGKNNKLFIIYKFTSLEKNLDKSLEDRRSKFGNFLRLTRLDEIPQLINVLKNDMSLIGPRPLLKEYLKIKKFRNHPRKKTKPGITGLAQISLLDQNKKTKWQKQFELDKKYVNKITFIDDFTIYFKTLKFILKTTKKDFLNEPKININK